MGLRPVPVGARMTGAFTVRRSGVRRIDLFPLRLDAILDLLLRHAQPVLIVADVDYFARDARVPNAAGAEGLARLVRARGGAARADPTTASVVLPPTDLPTLLLAIHHWNVHCWDAPRPPRPSVLATQAAAVTHRARARDVPALHLLAGARLFVDSHDDAYLTVEARGPGLVRAIFARALAELAAGPAGVATGHADRRAADAPEAVVEHFWANLPAFDLRVVEAPGKPGRVRIAFAARGEGPHGWVGVNDFHPRGYLDYDLGTDRWVHRYG